MAMPIVPAEGTGSLTQHRRGETSYPGPQPALRVFSLFGRDEAAQRRRRHDYQDLNDHGRPAALSPDLPSTPRDSPRPSSRRRIQPWENAENSHQFSALQIHAGQTRPGTNARHPIYQTTSYTFESAEQAPPLCPQESATSTPASNPTTDVFEKRVAALEGGVAASRPRADRRAVLALTTICEAATTSSRHQPVRGHLQPAQVPSHASHRRAVRRGDDLAAFETAIDERTSTLLKRSQPALSIQTLPRSRACARPPIPLVVDNTFGCAGYLCADRARRRHRRAVGHQVDRRHAPRSARNHRPGPSTGERRPLLYRAVTRYHGPTQGLGA